MLLRWTRSLAVAALAATSLAATASAQTIGGDRSVTLLLRPELGEPPRHLCVLYRPRQGNDLELVDRVEPWNEPDSPDLGLEPGAWLSDPTGVEHHAAAPRCEGQFPRGCLPRITLPDDVRAEDLKLDCASENTGRTDGFAVFVLVRYSDGTWPRIRDVSLTRGLATILLGAARGVGNPRVQVVGGHYEPAEGRSRSAVDNMVEVPLAPRCAWFDVDLPAGGRAPLAKGAVRDLLAILADSGARVCAPRALEGRSVLLPKLTRRERLVIAISQQAGDVSEREQRAAQMGVRGLRDVPQQLTQSRRRAPAAAVGNEAAPPVHELWAVVEPPWPSGRIRAHLASVAFSWKARSCVFGAACPTARIAPGIECQRLDEFPVGDACHYRCPEEELVEVELDPPVTVELTHPLTDQVWRSTLSFADQRIEGYVDPQAIQLRIASTSTTWGPDVVGDRVTYLDLVSFDGRVNRIPMVGLHDSARPNIMVPVPNADCSTPVRYRYVGERQYKESVARVERGHLWLDPPAKTSVTWTGRFAAFGGLAANLGLPGPTNWTLVGSVRLSLEHHPPGLRFSIGAGLADMFTAKPYGPITVAADGTLPRPDESATRTRLFNRLLFEPQVAFHWSRDFHLVVGPSLGGSWPITKDSRRRLGTVLFTGGLRAGVRGAVSESGWLIGDVRLLFERAREFSTDLEGEPTLKTHLPPVLLVTLGAEVEL